MNTVRHTRRDLLKTMGLGAVAMTVPRSLLGADKSPKDRPFDKASAFAKASADRPADKPNVLLIFTDDQGTLDANCYGSKDLYTPTMDALAAKGVRFTQAYAHTVCCPARALLMTGRHPQRSNVNSWMQGNAKGRKGLNMNVEEVTLAEALTAAGYRTALFGKWHLGSH